jgi:hypothetical protein
MRQGPIHYVVFQEKLCQKYKIRFVANEALLGLEKRLKSFE